MIQSDIQVALNSYVIDSKLIKEYRRTLNKAGKNNKVSLVRVFGDSGIKGNYDVYTLARTARSKRYFNLSKNN